MPAKTVQHGFLLLLLLIFGSLPVLAGQAAATLELRISSGGKPTVARVYITDGNGQPHRVPGAITYWRRGETHSVVAEAAAVALPAEATALERGMPVVTRNPRHFQRIPNLRILSY